MNRKAQIKARQRGQKKRAAEGTSRFQLFTGSLFCLILSSLFAYSLFQSRGEIVADTLFVCSGGIMLGIACSFPVKGKLAVFIHEMKHAITSGLVGNKAKGMKITPWRGEFQFEYTKRTKKYNTLILTAPYWFPLCTVSTAAVLLCAGLTPPHYLAVLSTATAFGFDSGVNISGISPMESDFRKLPGGISSGMHYVFLLLLVQSVFFFTWLLLGPKGLLHCVYLAGILVGVDLEGTGILS